MLASEQTLNDTITWSCFVELCDGEMSPAKTGSLFSPTFRFPDTASSHSGSRPVTPSVINSSSPETTPSKLTVNHQPPTERRGLATNGTPTRGSPQPAAVEDVEDDVFITTVSPQQVRLCNGGVSVDVFSGVLL